ncbi:nuclear transport factor 2 family protein [Permianibacter sp. IMCC34836]|uniref:nuclear transport factor 2 family protein n=1 Tax=Permianibacter fluminis TaxID=2738515 RepID=UPI0015541422|nr:nuclear transport factor 2 family protein [Permianibacter fluminis]NQD36768.1 nuclear transport factor 2 family protein [Permianibacter fluminis]
MKANQTTGRHVRRHGAAVSVLMLTTLPLFGQAANANEQAVLAAVQGFFDALASHDVAAAEKVLMPDARAQSVRRKDGALLVRNRAFHEDFASWPTRKEQLLERMWAPQVNIHGSIATVWTAYDFHIDGKFSHCGVDAFDLVQQGDGWKIVNVLYTVETEACADSPLGKPALPQNGGAEKPAAP